MKKEDGKAERTEHRTEHTRMTERWVKTHKELKRWRKQDTPEMKHAETHWRERILAKEAQNDSLSFNAVYMGWRYIE